MLVEKWRTLCLGFLLLSQPLHAAILCLSCSDVLRPRYCEYVTTCGDHQVCYVESYATISGNIRFNLGCRDSRICYNARSDSLNNTTLEQHDEQQEVVPQEKVVQQEKVVPPQQPEEDGGQEDVPGFLLCDECCSTPLCNQAGCGETGFPTDMGPLCYSCIQQRSPRDCNKVQLCNSDEVCSLSARTITGDLVYMTSCEPRQQCAHRTHDVITDVIGRRQTEDMSCSSCCGQTLCNIQCQLATSEYFVPTLDPCINYIPECERFSYDICLHTYAVWARKQCPGLCNRCQHTTTAPPTTVSSVCVDNISTCAHLDNGRMCSDFPAWSAKNCYKYCNYSLCK